MAILEGKAVVITGAGQGLGEAYALHAARSGACVVVNDVDGELAEAVADRIVRDGGQAVFNTHSVCDPGQASRIIERCRVEFGRVDGLVNNAALGPHEVPPWEEDSGAARDVIEVNVMGVLYCGIAAAKVMRAQGGGSIVNISSGASFGQRRAGAYSASKGAVASLTYAWALDLEEAGIRVNGVCPLAWTRLVERSPAAQLRCTREHTPERVAPLVTYLLSDLADGITGQLIRCTGDKLHIVRQPAIKEPVLRCTGWDTEDIAAAFDGILDEHLEPFGLEKRIPPRLRAAICCPTE
ncbi:MAG TPA: SDR family oxidoreductase [Pseudonocardiaceae bacterium]|jgi:NAD(P)-dependent dehydrogenase (short-subunit alcohol dehydrogenase family)|nr:SDR family oxidoreductase [Pseudonocardiaceae bacterium]